MMLWVKPRDILSLINEYEGRLFGKDFRRDLSEIDQWLRSKWFFWSCVGVGRIRESTDILGSLSILVTTEEALISLSLGEIRETDLPTWAPGCGVAPGVYYCSYSALRAGAGRLQFAAAQDYFRQLEFSGPAHLAVSIAATDGGRRHLLRSGFGLTRHTYMSKYPILWGECDKLALFWRSLMRCA